MSWCKTPQPTLMDSAHFLPQFVRARRFPLAPTLASLASLNTRHGESRTTMAWLFPFDDDLLVSAMVHSRQTTPTAMLWMKFPTAGKHHSQRAVPSSPRTRFICEVATVRQITMFVTL